jgi:Tol biopolymer transport system component
MSRSVWLTTTALVVILASMAALVAVVAVPKEAEASFPGKNGLIAFASNDLDGDLEIYKMRPDGSNLKQVTHNTTNDTNPTWSPDGTKIAFERLDKIFVKDMTNGRVVRLTDNAGISSFQPAWSPDGTRIAFVSSRDGGGNEIYTMNSSDGSGVRKLTDNGIREFEPTWSPDGTRIAFNREYKIWVMDADGADQKQLTEFSGSGGHYDPDWSPDGTKIAYVAWNETAPEDIWVMNADGSAQRNVTNSEEGDRFPVWSPNGRKIAYTVNFDDMWTITAEGTSPTNITNTPASIDFQPSWQPIPTP